MPYPLSIRQIAYVPENTKNPKLGNRIPFFVPTLSAIVLGIRDEGGKGRQKFVEDLVRHSGRKTLLYRHIQGGCPFYPYPGLKPRAESCSPFGTKIDLNTCPQNRSHSSYSSLHQSLFTFHLSKDYGKSAGRQDDCIWQPLARFLLLPEKVHTPHRCGRPNSHPKTRVLVGCYTGHIRQLPFLITV
jgi:hypothetical protein